MILGYNLSYLELFGTIFSFIAVVLASRAKVWNWPIGIIGQTLFFILFYKNNLLGQALLQVFLNGMCIYGWIFWSGETGKKIKTIPIKRFIPLLAIIVFCCLIASYALSFYQSQFVILDASITILTIFAIILLSKKYLNAWYLWLTIDALSITLYYMKGLYLVSFEYMLIIIVAVMGLIYWTKISKL